MGSWVPATGQLNPLTVMSEASSRAGWRSTVMPSRRSADGLTDDQLVARAVEPSTFSLLGLVRHMAEMERAYGGWALGPRDVLEWVWGSYLNDAEDDFDCDLTMVGESLRSPGGTERRGHGLTAPNGGSTPAITSSSMSSASTI